MTWGTYEVDELTAESESIFTEVANALTKTEGSLQTRGEHARMKDFKLIYNTSKVGR